MKPIKLSIKHAIEEKELLKYSKKVEEIHDAVINKKVAESEYLGWIDLPNKKGSDEIAKMEKIAATWKKQNIEVLVVIGIGGSNLGTKAGYEYFFGRYPLKNPDIELIFAGDSLSSEELVKLLKYVDDKKFAINIVSKSGSTLEPSIAFREFRKLIESKLGIAASRRFIVATTDKEKGILFDLAKIKGYEMLVIPDSVAGRFSVLSPVGLFPLLCAGVDINKLLDGAKQANNDAQERDLLKNDSYKYAVTRHILGKNYKAELLVSYEPRLKYFAEWWKQLFAESEGKNGLGLLPMSSIFSTDLHSIGQLIQDGQKILFETVLYVNKPTKDILFKKEKEDLDKLNYLCGKTLHDVNLTAYKGTIEAHYKSAKVPNIEIEINKFDEYALGYLFQFFEWSLTMSAYLLGVNPFNQPGVEIYKSNMFKLLGKDKKN